MGLAGWLEPSGQRSLSALALASWAEGRTLGFGPGPAISEMGGCCLLPHLLAVHPEPSHSGAAEPGGWA